MKVTVLIMLIPIITTLKTNILFAIPLVICDEPPQQVAQTIICEPPQQVTQALYWWEEDGNCIVHNNNAITTFNTCYLGIEEKTHLAYDIDIITAVNLNIPPTEVHFVSFFFRTVGPSIKIEPINTNYKYVKDSINLFGFHYLLVPHLMNKQRLLFLSLYEKDGRANYGLYFDKNSKKTFLDSRNHNCLTKIGFDGKLSDIAVIGVNYNNKRNVIGISRGKEDIQSHITSVYSAVNVTDNTIFFGDIRKGYMDCHAPSITNEYGITLEEEINSKSKLLGTSFTASYFYPVKQTLLVPSISFTYDTISSKSFLLKQLTFTPGFLLKATNKKNLELILKVDKRYYLDSNVSKKSLYSIGTLIKIPSIKNFLSVGVDFKRKISEKGITTDDFFVSLSIKL